MNDFLDRQGFALYHKKITEYINKKDSEVMSSAGKVNDVIMDGKTIVVDKVANIDNSITAEYIIGRIGIAPVGRAKADKDGNAIDETYATIDSLKQVEAIAIGRSKSSGAENLVKFQEFLNNNYGSIELKFGDNIFIVALDEPDLWCYGTNDITENQSLTEEQMIEALGTAEGLKLKGYTFHKLETQKVDLSNYVEKEEGKGLSENDFTDELKSAYDNHVSSKHANADAEKNQNAFSSVAIDGQPTVNADSPTSTLTIKAGERVSLTSDSDDKTVTINASADDIKIKNIESSGSTITITFMDGSSIGFELDTSAADLVDPDDIIVGKAENASLLGGRDGSHYLNYNNHTNTPIVNANLSDFIEPAAGTYYRHVGLTDDTFASGVIYYYDGSDYHPVPNRNQGDRLEALEGATLHLASLPPEIGVIANDGIHYLVPEVELELQDGRLIYMKSRSALPITPGTGIQFKKNANNTVSINVTGSGGSDTGGDGASGLVAHSADEMYEILSDANNSGKTVVYLGETTYDGPYGNEIKYKQNELYILADDGTGTGYLKAERAGQDTIKSIAQTIQTNTEIGYEYNLHSQRYFKLENVEVEYSDGRKGTIDFQMEIPFVAGRDISLTADEKGKVLEVDLKEDAKQIKVASIPELIDAYATYSRDCGKLITYPFAKAGTPFMYEGETIKEFYFNDISYIDFSQLDYDDSGVAYLLKAGESSDSPTEFMVGCVDMSKQTNGQISGHYFAIIEDQTLIARYANFSHSLLGIEYGWTFGEGFEPNKLIDLGRELVISYMGGGVNIYPIVLLAQTISITPFVESDRKGVYMVTEQPDGSVKAEKIGGGLPKFSSEENGKFLAVGGDGSVVTQDLNIRIAELENVLQDILKAIQSGELSSMTVGQIEDLIVAYFENKEVEEIEAK